jgi:hypothetical protein
LIGHDEFRCIRTRKLVGNLRIHLSGAHIVERCAYSIPSDENFGQFRCLIGRLEKELARLRNLPFLEPAPLEDLPEVPSEQAARVMSALDDDGAQDFATPPRKSLPP